MAVLLLRLKHVPEDEHGQVIELLENNDIPYYETHVGFWGVGMAGIWLSDETQLEKAQQLLQTYMSERQLQARQAYEQSLQDGSARTLLSTFKQQPIMFLLYIALAVGLLAITLGPFLAML